MGIDESWSDHPVASVNRQVNVTVKILADMDDLVTLDDDATIFQDAVLPVLEADNRPGVDSRSICQRSISLRTATVPAQPAMVCVRHRTLAEGHLERNILILVMRGHRIVSAGVEGVATQNPAHRHVPTLKGSIGGNRLVAVLRARGDKPA